MDFLLIGLGSHGDVHPFVGIGRGLRARGHRVRLAANDHFRAMVEKAGLEFVSAGDEAIFKKVTNDPDVWHATRGPQKVLEHIGQTVRDVYDMVVRVCDPNTYIVGSTLALGARCASENHGYSMATVHLAPICIRSCVTMPALPATPIDMNRLPLWMRKGFWKFADRFFIDPMIAPVLNTFRAEIGLAPVKGIQEWWHSPQLVIGLWPEWFFPPQSDYPKQVRLAGFPLYDESDHVQLDADLESFLNAEDAPIAFTPGSAMLFGHKFFESAVQACQKIGRRGLLLTRHPEQIPKNLPASVKFVPFAPFGVLLPRCGALVHHGGIGTTAQGLQAGIPQLIMPMSHDQFDNAAIVKRLGVGDECGVKRFTGNRVSKKLADLLESEKVKSCTNEMSRRIAADRPIEKVIALLEESSATAKA